MQRVVSRVSGDDGRGGDDDGVWTAIGDDAGIPAFGPTTVARKGTATTPSMMGQRSGAAGQERIRLAMVAWTSEPAI